MGEWWILVVVFLAGLAVLFRKGIQRVILRKGEDAESGYVAVKDGLVSLIGAEGRTLTPLRPAGTARIDGNNVDVVADGEFIRENVPVVVHSVVGARVVVRKKEEEDV